MMAETIEERATPQPTWVIMPFRNSPEMTLIAVGDALAQTVPTRVLLVDQGASQADREVIDRFIEQREDHRVLCWHFLPMLPSLSMVWNRGLAFVWELGGEEALVVNNDVRLHRQTVEVLRRTLAAEEALFVSCVGVRDGQFDPDCRYDPIAGTKEGWLTSSKGGPDYSCFLIAHAGHWTYPFDEGFIPAFREDLDSHRRYMLGGDGAKIFSVNVPFLHYASGTLKAYSPEERAKFNTANLANRAYYQHKWGGDVNEETYTVAFDAGSARAGVTTPELQRRVQAGAVGEAVLHG